MTTNASSPLSLLPNALTVARIGLAVAFPFVPAHWRLGVLAAALLTEFLDGVLARRFGWTSRFGRVLDPIADRCVFVAVAVTLLVDGSMTPWQLLALGARDLLVAGAALTVTALGHAAVLGRMKPRFPGKLTTALQYLALFWVLLVPPLPAWLAALTLATGLLAAAQYLLDFRRLRSQG